MANLVIGTMNFGKRTNDEQARQIVARALEAGVTAFDTANVYSDGDSERILGQALGAARAQAHVATKLGLGRSGGRAEGLSRAAVLAACEASLARLGGAPIDLLYLHMPDPKTPIEETLEGIGELLTLGKIKSWGVSNFASWQVLELIVVAQRIGLPRPRASQVIHNLLVRQIEIEHLPFAARYAIDVVTYNPLAGGLLAGRHREPGTPPRGSRFDANALYRKRYWSTRMFERAAQYRELAERHGLTLMELAYGFAFQSPGIGAVLLGPASATHLEDALTIAQRTLPPELIAEVEALHLAQEGGDARYAR